MNPTGKIIWRLVPFLCLLFIVNYLDRTNVAMAKLPMVRLGILTDATFGLGSGLFFIGYCLFEVPSNLILHRVGARRWIARIMITWGICSAALMFVQGPLSFYAIRFLLGLAEAGFFPGIVLYLTFWVPAKERSRVLALFLTSTATSGVIGNPLAGALMKLDGLAGLQGWQWLFLLEGIPPVILGILILSSSLLPDGPAAAKWLTTPEKTWVTDQLKLDGEHAHLSVVAELSAAAADPRLWLLSVIYFMLVMGLYGFVFWVPTLVKSFAGGSDAHVGLLSAIPYLIAVIAMVLIGIHADRAGQRRRHVATCAAIGAIGVTTVAFSHGATLGLASLSLAAIGIFSTLGPFWCIPTRYLRGTAAAGGIAVINSTGALAGFVAPFAVGWAKDTWGHYTAGLLLIAVALAVGAALVLCVPPTADAQT